MTMIKQLRPIIEKNEEVLIYYEKSYIRVNKQKLYDEVEKFCREKEDLELNLILGCIISIKAMFLKDGVIECFFQQKNLWSKSPELKILKKGELYKLLKEKKHFD